MTSSRRRHVNNSCIYYLLSLILILQLRNYRAFGTIVIFFFYYLICLYNAPVLAEISLCQIWQMKLQSGCFLPFANLTVILATARRPPQINLGPTATSQQKESYLTVNLIVPTLAQRHVVKTSNSIYSHWFIMNVNCTTKNIGKKNKQGRYYRTFWTISRSGV